MKTKKRLAVLVGLSLLGVTPSAPAGFVSDWVEAANGSMNVTQAGVVQGAALNAVTAGGFVFKSPRKEFHPVSIRPPSLKAGCGGIDLFLGAFSIPSREEFVSFLRSVGTALPGLAFQLALQTMAPDLNEMVGRYSDLIRSYTNRYTDSCSAAQALLEHTGAAEQLQRAVHTATNALRSNGTVSDQSEADRRVRSDGAQAIASAPTVQDAAGTFFDAPELNLTWALLSGGTFVGLGESARGLKETMMTLVGTTVFRQTGSGADAVLNEVPYAPVDLVPALLGEVAAGNLDGLACDETKRCLNPKRVALTDIDLTARLSEAAKHYLDAVAKRNPALVSDDELLLLGGLSSVPLIRVLNLATLSRYDGIAADLVRVYVQAAAYEMLTRAVETLARDARVALATSAARGLSKVHVDHVQRLEARLNRIDAQLASRHERVMQAMVRAGSVIEQIEHLERSIKTNEAMALHRLMPTVGSGLP